MDRPVGPSVSVLNIVDKHNNNVGADMNVMSHCIIQ